MDTITLKKSLLTWYKRKAFTHNYILGFKLNGLIYCVETDENELDYVVKLDKASRGNGYSLRFKPNTTQKNYLISLGAKAICSEDYFEGLAKMSRYNKGEVFEKIVTEKAGHEWFKDNYRFDMCGDLEVNGISYQIKFEGATFANEAMRARMGE